MCHDLDLIRRLFPRDLLILVSNPSWLLQTPALDSIDVVALEGDADAARTVSIVSELRRRSPDLELILLDHHGAPTHRAEVVVSGASDFFGAPWAAEAVADRIDGLHRVRQYRRYRDGGPRG